MNKHLYWKNQPATINPMSKMFRLTASIFVSATLACGLGGCAQQPAAEQFWQRTNPSQSIYMHGAKAQQMLQRDIQNCVNELTELERLHQLDDPIPTTFDGSLKEADPSTLYTIKVQGGDTALFNGASDYTNFDGCMYAKGWERIKSLPYNTTGSLNMNPRREKSFKSNFLAPILKAPPKYDPDTTLYRNTNE